MPIVLIHAGELADPRSLQECLREVHESDRESVIAEINRRTTNGALHDEPSGELKDPGPFVPDPRLDDVKVHVRILSATRADILDAKHTRALTRYLKANDQPDDTRDPVVVAELKGAIFDARRAYVAEAIASIEGIEGAYATAATGDPQSVRLTDSTLDALERAMLVNPLFIVARHAQRLDAKKLARFGLSPASTSAASTAASAQSIAIALAGVTEAVSTSTGAPQSSPAPSTQPTPVLGGI